MVNGIDLEIMQAVLHILMKAEVKIPAEWRNYTKTSTKKVGTKEFAEEVVKRLGQKPSKLRVTAYSSFIEKEAKSFVYEITRRKKISIGLGFIDMNVNFSSWRSPTRLLIYLTNLASAKIDFIKVENLYNFDDKPVCSLAQGE